MTSVIDAINKIPAIEQDNAILQYQNNTLSERKFGNTIRSSFTVSEIVGRKVTLKSNGSEHSGLCPFHREKSPSFTVSDSKGFYHCFGCGAHGDIIKFIMETEGLSFINTLEKLAAEAGLDINDFHKEYAEEIKKQAECLEIYRKAHIACFKKYTKLPSCSIETMLLLLSGIDLDSTDCEFIDYYDTEMFNNSVSSELRHFIRSAFNIDDIPIAIKGTEDNVYDSLVRPKIFIKWCIDSDVPLEDDIKLLVSEVLENKAIIAENIYTTPYLELMKAAIVAHEIAPNNQGKVDFLKEWFKENGNRFGVVISDRQASTMASFIRLPESAKGGNKPSKK